MDWANALLQQPFELKNERPCCHCGRSRRRHRNEEAVKKYLPA
ncbi:MAG: hypothetical protein ABI619_13345 [Betaproteobacteria bacterium]